MRFSPLFWLAALSLFPSAALQAEEVPASLHLGFYSKAAVEIPSAVRDKAKFIYKFEAPYFTTATAENYESLLANADFPPSAKEDLLLCRRAGLPTCVFHFGKIRGSAFLDSDGKSIWTNCHIVFSWISYQEQSFILAKKPEKEMLRALLHGNIPFTLSDAEGNRILRTDEENNKAVLRAAVLANRLQLGETNCSLGNDAVKIGLPFPLAESGLQHAKDLSGEVFYAGGFPRPTDSRKQLGLAESDGESFYWSFGAPLEKREEILNYLRRESAGLEFSNPYAFALEADGAEGMSGGAVLNPRGELVGIFKGLIPLSKERHEIPLAAVALSLDQLRFVELFSEDFPQD